MRELKFRAWDIKNNRYVGVHRLILDQFGAIDYADVVYNGKLYKLYPSEVIIEQYTGIKDKNGKEICEGDIVRCYSRRKTLGDYQVIWNEDCGGFECESLEPLADGGGRMLKDVRVFCEIATHFRVIGNIHENGDLLGDTNVTNKERE